MAASTTVQDIGSGRIIVADQVNPSLQIVYDPTLGTWHTVKSDSGKVSTSNYVWDTGSLAWVKMTQPTGGGAGGGNAAAGLTGAAVPTSAGYTGYNSGGNLVGVSTTNPLPVAQQGNISIAGTVPVSGTFFQATQPVSIASSVAVTGPVTDAQLRATALPVTGTFFQVTQPVSFAWTGLTDTQLRASPVSVSLASTTVTGTVAVTGTFFQATQPVSISSIPTHPVNLQDGSGVLLSSAQISASQSALSVQDTVLGSRIENLMELLLVELRVISFAISQLSEARPNDPDTIRQGFTLLN